MSANDLARAWVIAALLAITGTGCTNRVGDLTVISTRQTDLSEVRMESRGGQRAKGSHCTVNILVPILPNLGKAVDQALASSGGDALIDQVTYLSNYFIGIGSITCLRVEGTAVKFARSGT